MISCLLGQDRVILFSKLSETQHLINFAEKIENYLGMLGNETYLYSSEGEARELVNNLISREKMTLPLL